MFDLGVSDQKSSKKSGYRLVNSDGTHWKGEKIMIGSGNTTKRRDVK